MSGDRDVLKDWVLEGVKALGGRARVLDVAKHIWQHHEAELRDLGDLFYSWQYDMRWAAQKLRDDGRLRPMGEDKSKRWELA